MNFHFTDVYARTQLQFAPIEDVISSRKFMHILITAAPLWAKVCIFTFCLGSALEKAPTALALKHVPKTFCVKWCVHEKGMSERIE
jgi:hypothetical protein